MDTIASLKDRKLGRLPTMPRELELDLTAAGSAPLGTHCLLDLFGCDDPRLDQPDLLSALLREAAVAAGATVLSAHHHRFEPHGVSAICVLAESHISVHTWPEFGSASVDVYTCGPVCDPRLACDWIVSELRPLHHDLRVIERGAMHPPGQRGGPSLSVGESIRT